MTFFFETHVHGDLNLVELSVI